MPDEFDPRMGMEKAEGFGVARNQIRDLNYMAKREAARRAEEGAAAKAVFGEPETFTSRAGAIVTRYAAPPFSVLDTRQGYWQERRRKWLALGIKSELGRGEAGALKISKAVSDTAGLDIHPSMAPGSARAFGVDLMRGETDGRDAGYNYAAHKRRAPGTGAIPMTGLAGDWNKDMRAGPEADPTMPMDGADEVEGPSAPGTSIFDPVLCELAYRWWCPPGGAVLDPFAGGSVRGVVAAMLGHPYTGIDLSRAQVEANREQAAQIVPPGLPMPTWIVGDSHLVLESLGEDEYDAVFTCPPYYDLEVYSDDPADLSNLPTYGGFAVRYREILEKAAARLRTGRFATVVVSEVRDKTGAYVGLVPDTIRALQLAGLRYYNEAVLVNVAGSLPLRVQGQFEAGRKLGRMHQNVISAVKGDAPRGWDHAREEPPDPQMGLGL